jgi:hypothetical protein
LAVGGPVSRRAGPALFVANEALALGRDSVMAAALAASRGAGEPAISVDTMKELVGDFRNNDRELCPKGQPEDPRSQRQHGPGVGHQLGQRYIPLAAAVGRDATPAMREVHGAAKQRGTSVGISDLAEQ